MALVPWSVWSGRIVRHPSGNVQEEGVGKQTKHKFVKKRKVTSDKWIHHSINSTHRVPYTLWLRLRLQPAGRDIKIHQQTNPTQATYATTQTQVAREMVRSPPQNSPFHESRRLEDFKKKKKECANMPSRRSANPHPSARPPKRGSRNSQKSTTSRRRRRSRSKRHGACSRSPWTARGWEFCPSTMLNPRSCTVLPRPPSHQTILREPATLRTDLAVLEDPEPWASRLHRKHSSESSPTFLTPTRTATPRTSPSSPSARCSSMRALRITPRPRTRRSWLRRFAYSRIARRGRLRSRICGAWRPC